MRTVEPMRELSDASAGLIACLSWISRPSSQHYHPFATMSSREQQEEKTDEVVLVGVTHNDVLCAPGGELTPNSVY